MSELYRSIGILSLFVWFIEVSECFSIFLLLANCYINATWRFANDPIEELGVWGLNRSPCTCTSRVGVRDGDDEYHLIVMYNMIFGIVSPIKEHHRWGRWTCPACPPCISSLRTSNQQSCFTQFSAPGLGHLGSESLDSRAPESKFRVLFSSVEWASVVVRYSPLKSHCFAGVSR